MFIYLATTGYCCALYELSPAVDNSAPSDLSMTGFAPGSLRTELAYFGAHVLLTTAPFQYRSPRYHPAVPTESSGPTVLNCDCSAPKGSRRQARRVTSNRIQSMLRRATELQFELLLQSVNLTSNRPRLTLSWGEHRISLPNFVIELLI